jgi:hypothetical protein
VKLSFRVVCKDATTENWLAKNGVEALLHHNVRDTKVLLVEHEGLWLSTDVETNV